MKPVGEMFDTSLYFLGDDASRMEITGDGRRFCTKPQYTKRIIDVMTSEILNYEIGIKGCDTASTIDHRLEGYTAIDAFACCGNDTLSLAACFDHVIACEIDPHNYARLFHNISVRRETSDISVALHNEDFFSVFGTTKKDITKNVFYFDPPWSNIDCRKGTIYFGNIDLMKFIDKFCLYAFIKVPEAFKHKGKYKRVNMKKFVILCKEYGV
jgi:hypothetical protein